MSTATPLRASSITAATRSSRFQDVRVFGIVTSTNDVAARLAERGAPPGLVVVADGQTEGRGRRGTRWISPPRAGLFLSAVIDRPERDIPLVAGAAGVAAAQAIRFVTGADAGVKWPNDVWIGGRKVGGILIEARGRAPAFAVAGIGINLRTPVIGADPGAAPAGGLDEAAGRPVSREALAAALLDQLGEALALVEDDPAELRRRYRAVDVLSGRDIVADTPGGRIAGRALDVDLERGIDLLLADGGRRQLRPEHTHVVAVGPR